MFKLKRGDRSCACGVCARLCELERDMGKRGRRGIVTNGEVDDPNAPTDEWTGRAGERGGGGGIAGE